MSTANNMGTALVTGASSGIGATYAERLAERGYNLLLVARDEQRLQRSSQRLQERFGVTAEVLIADLSEAIEIERVAQRLRRDHQISLLVNNAGVALSGSMAESDRHSIAALLQLNVLALTLLSSAAAVNFSIAGRGGIINLGSVTSLLPERFNAVYAASKAYVLSLTQSLHAEIGDRGVRVQAVLPGMTRTEIWQRSGMTLDSSFDHMIMEAGDMVDAALRGFDEGEQVTIAGTHAIGTQPVAQATRRSLCLKRNSPGRGSDWGCLGQTGRPAANQSAGASTSLINCSRAQLSNSSDRAGSVTLRDSIRAPTIADSTITLSCAASSPDSLSVMLASRSRIS